MDPKNPLLGLYDLTGRVALVTGGADGIGFAVARYLGCFGAAVAIMDRNEGKLHDAVDTLRREGVHAHGWAGDISDEVAVDAIVGRAERDLGSVSILINNAGFNNHALPEHQTLHEWHKIIATNLTGTFLVSRSVARRLLDRGKHGAIVNVSSIAGSSALGRGNFTFAAAKAGVNQMTRDMAIEWGRAGIRVNAVQPCQVNTSHFSRLTDTPGPEGPALLARMVSGIPLGRLAEAGEVAAAVHFLVSDAASMITGVILPVDGGNLSLNAGGSIGQPSTTGE